MNISDLVSIICAIVSAVAAVIAVGLSVFVYIQGRKHDRKIDERDELRHQDVITEKVNQFLYQHNADLPYLPLAYAAMLYDSDMIYTRPLYSILHTQSCEVQEAIAKKFGLSALTSEKNNIYEICYQKALELFEAVGAVDGGSSMMYDSGKYWYQTVERYSGDALIPDYFEVTDFVSEVLSGRCVTLSEKKSMPLGEFLRDTNPMYSILDNEVETAKKEPIQYIIRKLQLKSCKESRCCQCMCIIIYYLAMYARDFDSESNVSITGLADKWSEDTEKTAEDLFFRSLLEVYLCFLEDEQICTR